MTESTRVQRIEIMQLGSEEPVRVIEVIVDEATDEPLLYLNAT